MAASRKKVPPMPSLEDMRIGVNMATIKLPNQLAEVVMDTASPRILRGNISLVTTHAVGLHSK